MLNTIAKRIQSRLSRQGLKISLGEIKEQCDRLIPDIENPTDQEVLSVVAHFLSTATKLTVVSDDVTTEDLTEVEETFSSAGGELGNIAEPTQMELETLTSEDVDIVNSVDNAINTASIQDIDSIDLHTNEAALDTENETALATATKSELVASTAGELGIVLNTGEIELIAQNVNYSSDDLQESLEEIKSAIIAFVRHKIALNSQKIGETLEEITQVATDGFNQNSQQLTDGLQNINKQLQQQRTDFKSKVKATLSVFQLPAAS
jgi:NACalpha-BTF3-like transcription factor